MMRRVTRDSDAAVLLVGRDRWAGRLASFRPAPLRAGAGDRSGESIVATGPVLVRYDEATKSPIPLDALYILDYKGGRLLATVPTYPPDRPRRRTIIDIVRRARPGRRLQARPGYRAPPAFPDDHRLARPLHGGLGAALRLRDDHAISWASTGSRSSRRSGKSSRPKFELVELRSYAKSGDAEPQPLSRLSARVMRGSRGRRAGRVPSRGSRHPRPPRPRPPPPAAACPAPARCAAAGRRRPRRPRTDPVP